MSTKNDVQIEHVSWIKSFRVVRCFVLGHEWEKIGIARLKYISSLLPQICDPAVFPQRKQKGVTCYDERREGIMALGQA